MINTPKGPVTGLMIGEKGIGWCKVSIKGESGHGSTPYKRENALSTLAFVVNKINNSPPRPKMTKTWREFIKGLNLGKLSEFLLTHNKTINFAIKSTAKKDLALAQSLHALTRMTITPTQAHVGQKINVIPNHAELYLDIRLLPGQTWDDVLKYFKTTFKREMFNQLDIQIVNTSPGTSDPWESDLLPYIKTTYNKIVSDNKIAPIFLPATSDARVFRQLGIKMYGFCVLTEQVDLKTMSSMIHGKDERVPIEAVHKSTQFFADLALNFLS